MTRFLVRLLLWFFIAALPLQGYAGVMRMCCAQGNAPAMDMDMDMASAATTPDGAAVGHAGPMARDMAHPTGHCAAMAGPTDLAGHAPQAGTDHGCAACAACCLAMALLPSASMPGIAAERNASAVALAPAIFLAGHIPAGLERPPRPFLA